MFTRIDTSSNGRINIEEFSQASVELKNGVLIFRTL